MSGQTILVVEDDESIRDMVTMILDSEGYRVLVARNGEEALQVLDKEKPALILLDMRMPVMNGWKFAETYRSRPFDKAPIVVMTAAADARQRADDIHAAGYLGKPFEIDTLLGTLQTVLHSPPHN